MSLVAAGGPAARWVLGPLTRVHRRHPEWPVLLLAAAGWVLLLRLHVSGEPAAGTSHHGHAAAAPMPAALADWFVMVTAMMVPTVVPAVRRVVFDSLRRRRLRAMTIFLVSYLALWLVFGVAAVAVITAVDAVLAPSVVRELVPVALLLVAAGYELSTRKRRFLRACHLPVALPPTGRRADIACARFGARHAAACLGSCGPLMLAMGAAGHGGLLLVVLVTAIVVAQKLLVVGTKLGVPAALALLVASLTLA